MGYKNSKEILPEELIAQIQKYVGGQNIYIPRKNKKSWGENTDTKQLLEIRNKEIFLKYQTGDSVISLGAEYHLSVQAIYKILSEQKGR